MRKSTNRQRRRLLKEEFTREAQSGKKTLPEETSARLLNALHEKIEEQARQTKNTQDARPATHGIQTEWLKWSVAALLLLLAGSLWRWRQTQATQKQPSVNLPLAQTIQTNNSNNDLHLILPDNSTVLLSPGSTIRYYPAFEPGQRNVLLSGKALFDVRADAARPFTVNAGDVNTTVLGTRFIISTLKQDKIEIHLLEGKVVVRTASKALAMREVYLQPGQQFTLDRQQRHYAVEKFVDSATAATSKKSTISSAVISTSTDTSILEFSQEPLPQVLATIGRKYGVVFRLNGHGFNTMSVTGKFLPSDSLKSVLSMLGSINGLSFTETGDTIVVARAQP